MANTPAPAQQTAGHTACLCATDECEHASDCAVHNEPAEPAGECDCRASMTPAQLRALPGAHYSDGRRYSRISKAWIFSEDWNDREEAAYQRERAEKSATQVAALQAENAELRAALTDIVACIQETRGLPAHKALERARAALTPRLDGEGR